MLEWEETEGVRGRRHPEISKVIEHEQLLRLVSGRHMWKVFSSKVDGPGKLISVAIDEQFRDKISETGSSIFFQFGKILVHGLRKSPEGIKEGEDIGCRI